MGKFITVYRDQPTFVGPVSVNTDHIAWVCKSKDGPGTSIRMSMDVGAGLHVSESYQKVMELIKEAADGQA